MQAEAAEDHSPKVDVMHFQPRNEAVMDVIINQPQIIIC